MSEDMYDALKYLVTLTFFSLASYIAYQFSVCPSFGCLSGDLVKKKNVLFLCSRANCPGAPFPIRSQLRLPSAVDMI